MVKLLVSDLDGTLLNTKQELSDYNAKAIKYAIETGVEFMVATGRSMPLIRPFLTQYGLHCGGVLLNGAEVRDKSERILSSINVDNSIIIELHSYLNKNGYMPFYTTALGVVFKGTEREFENAICNRQMCLDKTCGSKEEALIKGLKSSFATNAKKIEDIAELTDESVEIKKIVVFDMDKEKNISTTKRLKKMFPMLSATASYPENIEINDKYAQKGYGLEKAIEVMEISKEEVVVFGDGINDLTMFERFPHSCAMANAVDDIKKIAEEIIDSNDNNGVGKKILDIISKN